MKQYFVYIMASKQNGTLYIGVTSNLVKRTWEHKNKLVDGFTKEYQIDKLVYFEQYSDPKDAITREKNIKAWNRSWKIQLIEEDNPNWEDLYPSIL